MAYLNKVMLIGNIGKDPEIRMTASSRKKVSFSLATSRRYRDNNGESKEVTEWHNVVGWGKLADLIEQLGVRKGMSLFVEGSVTYRSWDDQNGQKRYQTDINMETFQLLSPRSSNPNYSGNGSYAPQNGYAQNSYSQNAYSNPPQNYGRAPQTYAEPSIPSQDDGEDTDLPF